MRPRLVLYSITKHLYTKYKKEQVEQVIHYLIERGFCTERTFHFSRVFLIYQEFYLV